MAAANWDFWRLTNATSGDLAWLGVTRRNPRSKIDRDRVRTLVPSRRIFLANWFVSEDRASGLGQWVHENIDVAEAIDIVSEVPEPSKVDFDRLLRPESFMTFDQIDRFAVAGVMGKKAELALHRPK